MATVTFTIPDEHVPRVIDAICRSGDVFFRPVPFGVELPQPSAARAKEVVLEWIRACVHQYEVNAEVQAIAAAKIDDVQGVVAP